MTLIILLFSLGILFIAVEVIVPGGILGAMGAVLMLGGCVASFMHYDATGAIIAIFSAILIGGLALWIEFQILSKSKFGKRTFLTKEITAVAAAVGSEARELIGKSAEALTILSPSGYVSVDGKRYEAFCQSGQVPAGADLKIIDADSFRLIVEIK